MRLIIGGKGQGKREYAAAAWGLADGDFAETLEAARTARALYAAENAVAACVRAGESAEERFSELIDANPELIVICDELGCGVVPVDAFEREWRERTGRVCCMLAKRAESVERVLCGLAMRIK